MKIEEFINALEKESNSDIHFEYEERKYIPVGYHLTEIINEDRTSMDCGGVVHQEKRIVIQLHSRSTDIPEKQLTAGKFSHILKIAHRKINLYSNVEVLIEYGSSQVKTATYSIQNIDLEEDGIKVRLFANAAVCKPAVNACGEGSSCC